VGTANQKVNFANSYSDSYNFSLANANPLFRTFISFVNAISLINYKIVILR